MSLSVVVSLGTSAAGLGPLNCLLGTCDVLLLGYLRLSGDTLPISPYGRSAAIGLAGGGTPGMATFALGGMAQDYHAS
jgi:hypothetical protein